MADLDDELRAAVQACDATPVVTTTSVGEPSQGSARGKGLGLLLGLVVLCGAILTLVLSAGESARFDVPVDRYMAEQPRYAGKTASHIQPQCPSKYEEAQRKGAVMPHTAVQ